MPAPLPPDARDLEDVAREFEREEYNDVVLDVEHHSGDALEYVAVDCVGHGCPPDIALEIGLSGKVHNTLPADEESSCIVMIMDDHADHESLLESVMEGRDGK